MSRRSQHERKIKLQDLSTQRIKHIKIFPYKTLSSQSVLGIFIIFKNTWEPQIIEIDSNSYQVLGTYSFKYRKNIQKNKSFPDVIGKPIFVMGRVIVLVHTAEFFYKKFNQRLSTKLKRILKKSSMKKKRKEFSKKPTQKTTKDLKNKEKAFLIFDLNKKFCDKVDLNIKDFLGLSAYTFQNMKLLLFGGLNRQLKTKNSLISIDLMTLQNKKIEILNPPNENEVIARFGSMIKMMGSTMICGGGFYFDAALFDFLKGSSNTSSGYQELYNLLKKRAFENETFYFWLFAKEFVVANKSVFLYDLKNQTFQYLLLETSEPYDIIMDYDFKNNCESKLNKESVLKIKASKFSMNKIKDINEDQILKEFNLIFSKKESCFLISKEKGKNNLIQRKNKN